MTGRDGEHRGAGQGGMRRASERRYGDGDIRSRDKVRTLKTATDGMMIRVTHGIYM